MEGDFENNIDRCDKCKVDVCAKKISENNEIYMTGNEKLAMGLYLTHCRSCKHLIECLGLSKKEKKE